MKALVTYAAPAVAMFFAAVWALTPCSAHAKEASNAPEVVIEGVSDPALRAILEELSALLPQDAQSLDSEVVVRGLARRHEERLQQALASEGYYGAEVKHEVDWTASSRRIRFQVAPGEPYRLKKLEVVFQETPDSPPQPPPPLYAGCGIEPGMVIRAETILDAEKRLAASFADTGYPFARAHDRRVVVNHDTHTANIAYFLALGRRMRFGPTTVAGLVDVREEVVLRELFWRAGEWYRAEAVKRTQEQLQKTGLFTLVRIDPVAPETPDAEAVPVAITVTERRHRSIGLGLQYRTDEGVGASAQWEHRNFWNLGRRLRLQGEATELEQLLSLSYDIQHFQRPDQTLTLNIKASQLDPDAYRSRRIDVGAWLERTLTPEWSVGMGPVLRMSDVEERYREERFYLASFPMQIAWDKRNDMMDPTRGFRVVDRLSPFVDVTRADTFFVKNELTATHYLEVGALPNTVVATRLRLGMMSGAGLMNIPADERFYAGGGGSIRGYAYQKVGPLDKENDPSGGRALTEWSVEIRKRLSQHIGLVAFVDGGTVHENTYPDFKYAPRWGAGIGLRYFTPVGPLRLDAAVPLNRRDGVDSSMQFYLSIGQAF